MKKIVVINGPNLNFLGIREKSVYGQKNYKDLVKMIEHKAQEKQVAIDVYQSNHEGHIIDRIQQCYEDQVDAIIINPGAYTHYSYAIRDAIASVNIKTIEVHISNIYEREPFRHVSVIKPVCCKQIYGKGLEGYLLAIDDAMCL
ncbi:type II 3-dehydroquinate dehydratase [Vallitalea pronyensis]|uniref:3-dehydroquinate dehydratase n=1 Tax=Vallitalea pronyensis TaxID=1348613 RepID=A0A8J8SHV6_9FIRM|nr:type II 3-dehydroquinate dehydratase [Vallitalea pronyensis]QUI23817.1 type II 3-dehydroquinate dehydratase [Vallitalea pronyensis]